MANKTALQRLRESERELESQLVKLRAQISKAERGENKRIKDANRYIARTLRNIERTSKAQEKLQEKELEKLERFLGETFESVSEAREALSKQTRKATKREKLSEALRQRNKGSKRGQLEATRLEREVSGTKLNPERTKYTIRELSAIQKQNIVDFVSDRKSFTEVGNNYLRGNERLVMSYPFEYYGPDGKLHSGRSNTYKVFKDWNALYSWLQYGNSGDTGEPAIDSPEERLGSIQILRFDSEYDAKVERGRQTDIRNKRRKDVKKLLAERRKKDKQKARASANEKLAKEKAKNKELKRQLKGRK